MSPEPPGVVIVDDRIETAGLRRLVESLLIDHGEEISS
jgi:hypothetical protein